MNKRSGRVGDMPHNGAGFWAEGQQVPGGRGYLTRGGVRCAL